jgi:hypothetical protein
MLLLLVMVVVVVFVILSIVDLVCIFFLIWHNNNILDWNRHAVLLFENKLVGEKVW